MEVAKNDTCAGIEYIKKVGQFRRDYFATLDTLNAMANQEGSAEKCQSYVVYCLLAYMNELVSMADINAKAYVMASAIAWKKSEEMHGIGSMVRPMHQNAKEIFEYVDTMTDNFVHNGKFKEIIATNKAKVKEVIDEWPFREREKAKSTGQPQARMKDEYGELGRVSIETMKSFRSIADHFDPSNGTASMDGGSCGDGLLVYAETKGLSVRVVNVMSMVMLLGLSQHYAEFPEIKVHEKYAKAWLELFFPGLDEWNRVFQELGERTSDQVIRKAAVEYGEQYLKCRKALEAALATDGLSLPVSAGN